MAKKMGKGGIRTRIYSASTHDGGREDGSGGEQRNSKHDRKVMRVEGGKVQKGRMSPRGARN